MTEEIYCQIVDLNPGIHGLVKKCKDGSYSILISAADDPDQQMKTYKHEIEHIHNNDFDELDVQVIESNAHGFKVPAPKEDAKMLRWLKLKKREINRLIKEQEKCKSEMKTMDYFRWMQDS